MTNHDPHSQFVLALIWNFAGNVGNANNANNGGNENNEASSHDRIKMTKLRLKYDQKIFPRTNVNIELKCLPGKEVKKMVDWTSRGVNFNFKDQTNKIFTRMLNQHLVVNQHLIRVVVVVVVYSHNSSAIILFYEITDAWSQYAITIL